MPLILIAASEPDMGDMLHQLFELDGYVVLIAVDGEQCLLMAEQHHPDIVVMTSTLTIVDAFTVCFRIRSSLGIPVIMITTDDAIDTALSAGVDDFVTRPIRPTVLRHRARRILENREVASLREREEWYRSIIENAVEGIYRSTPQGDFVFVNPALVRMLGYSSSDEVLALNIHHDIEAGPDDPAFLSVTIELNGDDSSHETIWKKRNGQPIFITSYNRPVLDSQGWVQYYEGIVLDITERKRSEAEQRNQRLLSEALRETATILNSELDIDRVLDHILEGARRVLQSEHANLMFVDKGYAISARLIGYGQPLGQDRVREVRLAIMNTPNLRHMFVSGQTVIVHDTQQDPNWVTVSGLEWVRSMIGAPIQVDSEIIGFLMLDSAMPHSFTDAHTTTLSIFAGQAALAIRNARLYEASQRYGREMENRVAQRTAELEQQRAQLQAILDSMNEGVEGIIYGENSTYRFTNAALSRMLGYEPGEVQSMTQLKPDDVEATDFMNMLTEIRDTVFSRGLWTGDMRFRHHDGYIMDIGITATRVSRPDGSPAGLVIVMRDESQEKALEAQKKRFVVSAAHELRTPLTNLNTRLFLARRQPERLDSHLDVIEKVVGQLQFLVEDLLNLSRFEHGLIVLERVRTELASFIKDTVLLQEAQAEIKDIWIIDRLPLEPIHVFIDQSRMLQVFSNLVTNAIKYTREGGAVTINLRKGKIGTQEEGYAIIGVEDTGAGIDPEHLPHIFEPFYKADHGSKGLGLGLSIIKEIIELHGGKITVASEPGQGTRFSVWLKLANNLAFSAG